MDTALLGLRVVLSLAVVLGLIWFAGRKLQGTAGVRRQRTVPLSVLGRQSLGKGAGIALVEVAGRVLLLGVGEQGVRVLTEVDVPAAPDPAERAGEVREEIDLSTLAPQLTDVPAFDEALASAAALVGTDDDTTAGTTTGTTTLPSPDGADGAVVVPTPHADGSARLAALAGLAGASATGASVAQAGALQGSILSPDTWRRAVGAVQRRTAR